MSKRNIILGLSALLVKVRPMGWTMQNFQKASKKLTENKIKQSEARRFYLALIENGTLVPAGDKRKVTCNLENRFWVNDDCRNGFVREVLERFPEIETSRKVKEQKPEPVMVNNPLEGYDARELVSELRSRGYEVICSRLVQVTETL